jgi:hypothetical protein
LNWFCEVFRGRRPAEGTVTLAPPPAGSRFETLVVVGSPVVDFPDGSPRWKELQVADMPYDDAAGLDGGGFLRVIEARRQDARVSRASMARDPHRMLSELMRCLGLPAAQAAARAELNGDQVDFETEPGLHVSGQWVKSPSGKAGRVALVVGKAEDRHAASGLGAPARFDLTLREERLTTSLSGPLWAFVILNRPPLGMWVWDAMASAQWLRRQGFDVELVGVGDAGALIAPMAAALSHDVASARVVNAHLRSLDEDVVRRKAADMPYWAHRLLWVADIPELAAVLKGQRRW